MGVGWGPQAPGEGECEVNMAHMGAEALRPALLRLQLWAPATLPLRPCKCLGLVQSPFPLWTQPSFKSMCTPSVTLQGFAPACAAPGRDRSSSFFPLTQTLAGEQRSWWCIGGPRSTSPKLVLQGSSLGTRDSPFLPRPSDRVFTAWPVLIYSCSFLLAAFPFQGFL